MPQDCTSPTAGFSDNARRVLRALDELGIASATVAHAPLRTVADSKAHRLSGDGGYSKNLFLRNKKGRMWLITLHEDRMIDLRGLGEHLGAGRVSFASTERLATFLGVIPGAVTPLAVINDVEHRVSAVLDRKLMAYERVHFHPCDNTLTTTLTPADLLAFMHHCGHEPAMIDFDRFSAPPAQ